MTTFFKIILFFGLVIGSISFGILIEKAIDEQLKQVTNGEIVVDSKGLKWTKVEIEGHTYLNHNQMWIHSQKCSCRDTEVSGAGN